MRQIDADALAARLENECREWEGESAYQAGLCAAAVIVAEAPTVKQEPTVGGWISVKDRLPKVKMSDVNGKIAFSDYVLIYKVYEDGTPWMTVDICRVDKAEWVNVIPGEGWTVTHWMPLPEPPEVEA